MDNEELTELCTRVATKVLGYELRGSVWVDKHGNQVTHGRLYWDQVEELASPWGRDLVEKAMEEMGFCHSHDTNIHLESTKYQFRKGAAHIQSIRHKDKNIACLLAADAAIGENRPDKEE